MIALFLVFLVCSSISFAAGAAFGSLITRIRMARQRPQLDIAPAIARYRRLS